MKKVKELEDLKNDDPFTWSKYYGSEKREQDDIYLATEVLADGRIIELNITMNKDDEGYTWAFGDNGSYYQGLGHSNSIRQAHKDMLVELQKAIERKPFSTYKMSTLEEREHLKIIPEWTAHWSGCFPNLCSGQWTLYRDSIEVDTNIPFQNTDAGTYGEYMEWHFGEDYSEEWDSYEEGKHFDAWAAEYKEWLLSISNSKADWKAIYEAFSAVDWRSGSCGGCI